MAHFQIVSSAGVEMGTYEADTASEALDAMARDAGYRDQADAASQVGAFDGTVTEVWCGQSRGPQATGRGW